VLVSGSAGFIGGYVVEELLRRGYSVIGIDDHSKYGPVAKSYDDHPDYRLVVEGLSDDAHRSACRINRSCTAEKTSSMRKSASASVLA